MAPNTAKVALVCYPSMLPLLLGTVGRLRTNNDNLVIGPSNGGAKKVVELSLLYTYIGDREAGGSWPAYFSASGAFGA